MSEVIRAAFSNWPRYNDALITTVAALDDATLADRPAPDRWPLWATIGHLACQRVFWLCDAAGEPGAADSPFPNAAFNCPGDDDLVNVRDARQLADDLSATFRIVERVLDTWTLESLAEVVRHPDWSADWSYTRGSIVQRVFAHDISHIAELNESLGRLGLAQVNLWD